MYAITNMGNFRASTMQPLYEEVTQYMAYLNKLKSDEVPMEKYKVVYGIEKTLKVLKLDERQSPEFLKAKKEHDAKNYDVAIPLWTALANKGNSWAMRNLGVVYEVKKDNEKAKEWYLKALENGNGDAAEELAEIDKDNARKYYEKAAEFGHPYGVYMQGAYAKIYDKNPTKAMGYYQQSAALGASSALNRVGEMYNDDKQYAKAFPYFKKAVIKGNLAAMNKLGDLYYDGIGVEENKPLAIEYWLKTANYGSSDGIRSIGWLYEGGRAGYPKDYTKAAEWYQKMIDNSNDDFGFLKLGDLYSLSDNSQPQKALINYEKAAEAGYYSAMLKTANLYFSGKGGITKDYAKAIKYYEKYYENKKKNESYIDNLIEMYSSGGNGIEKNKEKAKYWKEIRRK